MIWKKIDEHPDYSVSDNGEVYTHKSNMVLKPTLSHPRYNYVTLDGRTCTNHSLVAKMFIPNPNNWKVVIHKDGDRHNNCINNLEWRKAAQIGVVNAEKIRELIRICPDKLVILYMSSKEAAEMENVSTSIIINRYITGSRKPSDGSIWMSKSDYDNRDLEENWKPIIIDCQQTGYIISDLGRVKSATGLTLKNYIDGGYSRVHIVTENKSWCSQVHRLVLEAFIGPPPNPECNTVDHINRERSDNRLVNLRWASRSEQMYNSSRSKKVVMMDMDENELQTFQSTGEAAKFLGNDKAPRPIRAVCNGYSKTACGYKWKYISD